MKTMIFGFLFSLSLAVVSQNAQAQVVKGGGGGGLRQQWYEKIFPGSKPCAEGETRMYQEFNQAQDQYSMVQRVCKNGSFYEKANIDYRNIRCTEGTIGVSEDRDPNTGNTIRKTFRCKNGERVLIYVENIARSDS